MTRNSQNSRGLVNYRAPLGDGLFSKEPGIRFEDVDIWRCAIREHCRMYVDEIKFRRGLALYRRVEKSSFAFSANLTGLLALCARGSGHALPSLAWSCQIVHSHVRVLFNPTP